MHRADTVIVLDFETSGLCPERGDRAIEIGAVKLVRGRIEERFQKLMNPGYRISGFIENYTGITNGMLAGAPCCEEVMEEFETFARGFVLVAHNASFDRRVLTAEYAHLGYEAPPYFICSMLTARRLYRDAPNHRLGTLVRHAGIPVEGDFHRALADAEMTAGLWKAMLAIIRHDYGISPVPGDLMAKLARKPRTGVDVFLNAYKSQV